ncbi:unnamed protein product [Caretta caretta]
MPLFNLTSISCGRWIAAPASSTPWRKRGAKKHILCLLALPSRIQWRRQKGQGQEGQGLSCWSFLLESNQSRCLWGALGRTPSSQRRQPGLLELPLTLAKFLEALHHMPMNKSPGMDRLTMEFYSVFWAVLGLDLAIFWAESLGSRVLPLSYRRAVLALLPKKWDLCDLRHWSPVPLISTDYKVMAKAISLRLESMLADVVHPDQTYTILGHTIFKNLYLVRYLLELGCRDGLSFTLLSLDQEKALDRMDHGYLLGTLQAVGFGPCFMGFLQVLYASTECLVRLNWSLTAPVSFGQGVHQGCPLSGQLYTLAIEPFLHLLRKRLTGLVLCEPGMWLVLSVYADDMLLVVQDPGDLVQVEACQAVYSAASSARVNWVKSSGLMVGPVWQASSLPPALQAIRWRMGSVLYLGVYLSAMH